MSGDVEVACVKINQFSVTEILNRASLPELKVQLFNIVQIALTPPPSTHTHTHTLTYLHHPFEQCENAALLVRVGFHKSINYMEEHVDCHKQGFLIKISNL